jgi:hypothetical protein
MVIKLTNNYREASLLPTSYSILSNILVTRLTPYIDENIGDYHCDVTDQLYIRYSAFIKHWRKNRSVTGQYISYL